MYRTRSPRIHLVPQRSQGAAMPPEVLRNKGPSHQLGKSVREPRTRVAMYKNEQFSRLGTGLLRVKDYTFNRNLQVKCKRGGLLTDCS